MSKEMEIGVIVEGISEKLVGCMPWIYFKDKLSERGIHLHIFREDGGGFKRPFDAMILYVWLDWKNKKRFNPSRIMPIMEQYAVYRAEFPETVQIVVNHTDMSRRPYATPYWRQGDPVLYRTPAYDRGELYPFPPETIWAFEMIWGNACFECPENPKHQAGFIGQPNGPHGFRELVAKETAKVGIGICETPRPYLKPEYDSIMSECQIIVCPRGWGEQSERHWDAWLSGKPVLTDRECDSVEMIPGLRLKEGVHYLVFEEPEEIPDMISDWTRPSRRDDLGEIAANGRQAALSYDALGRITEFFRRSVP